MLRFLALILLLTLFGLNSPAWAMDTISDIQKFLSDNSNQFDLSSPELKELDSFYALRGYRVAWNLSDETSLKKTLIFLDSITSVIAYHGLGVKNYSIDDMRALASSKDMDRLKLEILITSNLLRLAHDLHGDSVDLSSLYTGWSFHRSAIDIPSSLNEAINLGKLGEFFDKLAPQSPVYRDLASALQDYRAYESKGGWQPINLGENLRPGVSDPRIVQLRARLTAEGYVISTPIDGRADYFDEPLSKVLMVYQTRNGLSPDGRLGSKTLESLNTTVATRISQIIANMERWRHMSENFPPDRYTVVNIPDYSVSIIENGKELYRGIVIVGRTDRMTPFIDSKIINMLVNPSWHVPVKIARKDILPKLKHDPHYLEKLGFVIAGREYDPAGTTIDWLHIRPEAFNYQLRQVPGDLNSLGQLKFNFVNPFDVYMHGTPHQELFDKSERDFSSGCVRLEDPEEFGEILLTGTKDSKGTWNEKRIQDEIDSGKTRFVPLANPMPIYFLYWSVFTTSDGEINFRKDVYGYDQLLINKIKGKANPEPE